MDCVVYNARGMAMEATRAVATAETMIYDI